MPDPSKYSPINVYQYRSRDFPVNKNACFNKYMYALSNTLGDDPENEDDQYALSDWGGANSSGVAFRVPDVTAEQAAEDGLAAIAVFEWGPYPNTRGFFFWDLLYGAYPGQPNPYYSINTWPNRGTEGQFGGRPGWPFQVTASFPTMYIPVPFFAFREPAEGLVPVYQYAYREIWFPSYYVYSVCQHTYDGTGLSPAQSPSTTQADGAYQIAFYAYPPE